MLRLALKGAMGHKGRLFLMATAIILGVAFIAGSYVFTDTLKDAFDVLFEQETAVDVVVRADVQFGFDTGRVPASLLPEVAAVPGVERALPSVQGLAQPLDKEGNPIGGMGPPNLAFSWSEAEAELTELVLREGRAPQGPLEVAIDAFTANRYGFALGDQIRILLPNTVGEFTVVGIAGYGDADNLLGATVVLFDLETAQVALNFGENYSQIAVFAAEGVDPGALQLAIAAEMPEGTEVILAGEQIEEGREGVEEGVGFFNTLLLAFAGIGIFVGAFLIQNTYRIVVAQRTRELGMLRAVGATGRQVTWMVLFEALVVGLVASAIGVGVGVVLAVGLRALLAVLGIDFPQGSLTVLPRTVIVGLLVGTVVTMASAILPARKASKIPPVAAMRELESTYFKSLRLRAAVGAGIVALGIALLLVGLYTELGDALLITGIGAGVTFIGVSVVAPLFARQFGRVAGSPLPAAFGVVGRLARENAVRKPRRTAATASALMIGVALVTIVATIVASAKQSIEGTVRDEVIGEYQVQPTSFGNPFAGGLSPELADRLRELPEVAVASSYRLGEWRKPGGEDVGVGYGPQSGIEYLISLDQGADEVVRLQVSSGDFADLAQPGTVMLHEGYAAEEGLAVGDRFPIQFPDGVEEDLEVVALFGADLFQTDVVISPEAFAVHYEWDRDQMVIVLLAEGVDAEATRPALEAIVADYPNAELNNAEEYVDKVASQLDLLLNVLTGMLAMAIVIALLGIANTLALSIMERKREIGLLRAVGMTRRQVRRMIRWEAVLIAVFGAVIGMLVGVGLGVAVVTAIGAGISLALPWLNLLVYLVLAAVGGVVASVVPGWRGSRLDVLGAISYE
ncbi:MAG: ABC transporter permease [Acidimicrobiia bacterium]|nr:ABC transporter permease [Acidimicrobiia bacterium]